MLPSVITTRDGGISALQGDGKLGRYGMRHQNGVFDMLMKLESLCNVFPCRVVAIGCISCDMQEMNARHLQMHLQIQYQHMLV